MIGLLAYRPGMDAAFDPLFTALALLAGMAGIGGGVAAALRRRDHHGRCAAGICIGAGIAALHYLGQAGYLVTGRVEWDWRLVAASVPPGLALCGLAMIAAGLRARALRRLAAPLLIAAIALLHFAGMGAAHLVFDPRVALPAASAPPWLVAPIVAGVSLWLLFMAALGLRFSRRARAQLRRDRARVEALAAVALEGLLISDGETVITANASLGRLHGTPPDALQGLALRTLLPDVDVAQLADHVEQDARLIAADGAAVPVRVVRSQVQLGSRMQMVLAVRDQRDRLRTEARLESLAFNDPLTGLANRGRFADLLAAQLGSSRRRDRLFAVLVIDIDRFKSVNDLLGQAAGDRVLQIVEDRLRTVLRRQDIVARLGGDILALLQPDVDDAADATTLAARIVEWSPSRSPSTASRSGSAPASASPWPRGTGRTRTPCASTPNWRCNRPRPMAGAPAASSIPSSAHACKPARRWRSACAGPWPMTSWSCISSR